jgi:hypothetical protein
VAGKHDHTQGRRELFPPTYLLKIKCSQNSLADISSRPFIRIGSHAYGMDVREIRIQVQSLPISTVGTCSPREQEEKEK